MIFPPKATILEDSLRLLKTVMDLITKKMKKSVFIDKLAEENSMTYRGYIEGKDVEDAICASFIKQPEVCRNITATALVEELTFST